jgi:RimJ/RimL family protein N-acetyltransferase
MVKTLRLIMIILNTKSLTLAPSTPNDAADFMALERDPEVMYFLNGGHAVDHSKEHPDATFFMPRGTEPNVWTARLIANGAFVGWFTLYPETAQLAELGYRLKRSEWGRGLATEGAATLVDWGFKTCAYEKVFGSTSTVNQGSRRVMEKIGMRFARAIPFEWPTPFPESELGEVVYEITREDWATRAAI